MSGTEPKAPIQFDINGALAQALIDKFFEPQTVTVGVDPNSGMLNQFNRPSPIALVAGLLYDQHARAILDQLWVRIDKDWLTEEVATRVADSVVKAYTERPMYGGGSPEQKKLHERILEIVAHTLGQRVVDQMDVQLSSRPEITGGAA